MQSTKTLSSLVLASMVAFGGFFSTGCGAIVEGSEDATSTTSDEYRWNSDHDDADDRDEGDDGDDARSNGRTPSEADPTAVYVERIRHHGSGCPRGSVAATISPNGQALTVIYNDLYAEDGPRVWRSSRKDCRVSLKLHIPAGHTASFTTVDTRGFVQLDQGVKATQTTSYRFPGGARAEGTSSFEGPVADSYVRQDSVENETRSRCGGSAKAVIDMSLRVDTGRNRHGAGLITVDTTDAQVRQVFNMELKPCNRWRR